MNSASMLAAMVDLVAHRGPDGRRLQIFAAVAGRALAPVADGVVGLAHTRLSIIDLSSAGNQPMADASRRWWLTYNGEIYNFAELRTELQHFGHIFRGGSDTEVLLAAWVQWGIACLDRLDGIFAFVVVDTCEGRIWAVRDRFGVKPLYWWRAPDGSFAIASEIKQFTAIPGWRAKLQPQRAYDFLAWNVLDHTESTLFDGVQQLRGGELLEGEIAALQRGRAPTITRWYTLRPDPLAESLEIKEAADRFLELLSDSVRVQLRADIDVGSCLSGGLDSSSLVCLASQLLDTNGRFGARQHTFSARSDVAAYDEGRYIAEVVRATLVQAHEILPPLQGLFAALPEITWHQDEPFGSTSAYAQWHVFSLAREAGVKVLLDGQGADEILGGYHGFFGPRLADLLRRGNWWRLVAEIAALRRLHGISPQQSLARMADAVLPNWLRQRARALAGRSSVQLPWLDHKRIGVRPLDPFANLGARQPTVRALSMAQVLSTNLPMLLHCEDRNSMAHGIEARVPFLNHRLVEFVVGLADEHKVSGGVTKRVLRESMCGILPEIVRVRRDKLGFVTPEEVWVRSEPIQFRVALQAAIARADGLLRPELIHSFDDMLAGKRPFGFHWWRAISFGAWMERFDVQV
jgi:asparagine synthase (glutamine-hydrolysing)